MGKYSLKEIEKMTGQKSVQVSDKRGASERRKTNIPADESRKLMENERRSQQESGTNRRGNVQAEESRRIMTREKNLKGGAARRESNADARAVSTEGANVAPSSSGKIPYLRNNDPLSTVQQSDKKNTISLAKEEPEQYTEDIDTLLADGYQMSAKEKKYARQYVKDYYKKYREKVQNGEYTTEELQAITNGENDEFNKIQRLDNKSKLFAGLAGGLASDSAKAAKGVGKITGLADDETYSRRAKALDEFESDSQTQSPYQYAAGNMAMKAAEYSTAKALAGQIPFLKNAGDVVSGKIGAALGDGERAQAFGRAATNVLADTGLDTVLDTLPSYLEDKEKGLSDDEIRRRTLYNVGLNLGGNVLGEAIPAVVGKVFKKKTGIPELGRTGENAAQVADSTGDASRAAVSQADSITWAPEHELSSVNQQLQENLETLTSEAQRLRAEADDILNIADAPKKITTMPKSSLTKESKFYTLDKEVSKLVRMYGDESNLDDLDTFRKAITEFETTGSSEAADTASMALDRIDKALQGKTYKQADRLTKSGALKRKGQTYTYGQEYAGINDLVDDAQQQFEDVFNTKGTFAKSETPKAEIPYLNNDTGVRTGKISAANAVPPVANADLKSPSPATALPEPELPANSSTVMADAKIPSLTPANEVQSRNATSGNSNIPFLQENVNGAGAKSSEELWRELSGETDNDIAYLGRAAKRQDGYVTRTATNTLTNSEVVRNNPEMQAILQDEINSGRMAFRTVHEDESIKAAQEAFKKDAAAETDRLMSTNWKQAQDFDGGMMLLKSAADSGDYESVRAIARKIASEGHDAGVRLQALEKYSRTAEGSIAKAQNILAAEIRDWAKNSPNDAKAAKEFSDKIMEYVKNGLDSGNLAEGVSPVAGEDVLSSVKQIIRESKLSKTLTDQDAEEIAKLLTKGYSDQVESTVNAIMATQQYGISDDTIDAVIEIFDKANKFGENSKARVELENQAYALLANEVTTSNWQDKWNTWRYFSMLSKPATHIRNTIGNIGMNVVSGVKNELAAVMESVAGAVNPDMKRTKALLNPLDGADRGLISAAAKDADDIAYRALSGSKYGATGGIKGQAKAFREGPGRAIQKMADFNSDLLEKEDWIGLKAKYSTSLAGYLKANNLGAEVFNATDDASQQFMNLAREYAIREAQRATFHESSTLADALSGLSQRLNESGRTRDNAVSMLIEGIVPFKKTPINIVKTAGRYSPIGIADAVQKGARAVSKGTYSASEVLDSLASGLTGTGIMALGAYLGSQGLVRGTGTDDEKQNSFDKLRGAQDYSLQVGDKNYTIDWAAPSVLPLLVGVELQQSLSDGGIDSSDIINAIASMADPVVETTMMSGISNALAAAQYAEDPTERLTLAATNAASGYITQGIPSMLGSVARAMDNTRRTAYPEKTGVAGQLERTLLSTKNKIPFLSEKSPEYRDAWGRTAENRTGGESLAGNLAYQIFSPGYVSEDNTTPVDNYVQGLYNRTGNSDVLPQNISRSFQKDGATVRMSGEDYSKAQEIAGSMAYELADYLRQNQGYITESDQADMVNSLYNLSKDVAYYRVGNKPLSDNNMKLWRLYRDGGAETLIPYLTMKQTADSNGNGQISQEEAKRYLDDSELSDVQKAYFWTLINSGWKSNPYK